MCCYVVLSNHVMRNCGNGLLFSALITMVVWNIAVAIPSYCLLYTWYRSIIVLSIVSCPVFRY